MDICVQFMSDLSGEEHGMACSQLKSIPVSFELCWSWPSFKRLGCRVPSVLDWQSPEYGMYH